MKNIDNQNIEALANEVKKRIEQIYGRRYEELSTKEKKAFLASEFGGSIERLKKVGGKKARLIKSQNLIKPHYSYFTLERLLGNNPDGHKMSLSNLHLTALFLGYESFGDFVRTKRGKKLETIEEKQSVVTEEKKTEQTQKRKEEKIQEKAEEKTQEKKSEPKKEQSPSLFKIWATTIIITIFSLFSIKNLNDLSNPLLIVGLVLLLFFGLYRFIVSSGIIQPLTQEDSSKALYLILRYGFYIALVTIVLGLIIGIYYKTNRASTETAKKLVIEEVLANSQQLDARLIEIDFALNELEDNYLSKKIKAANDTLFPRGGSEWNKGYDELILQTQLGNIQQVVTSRPLQKTFSPSVVNNIISSHPKYGDLFFFYLDQLNHVEWRTQTLQKSLTSNISSIAFEDKLKEINLRFSSLVQHSIIANIYGIEIINSFESKNLQSIHKTLANLKKLTPKEPVQQKYLNDLLQQSKARLDTINEKMEKIADERESLVESGVEDSKQIVLDLEKPNENDGMAEVGGKIISLRGFGRIEAAIKKAEEFRERFATNDTNWNQYVEISQKLSKKAKELDVYKGKYIMKLSANSSLKKAGLKATDIMAYIDGQIAADIVEQADLDRVDNKMVEIIYLRSQPSGEFAVKKAEVKNILKGATLYGI